MSEQFICKRCGGEWFFTSIYKIDINGLMFHPEEYYIICLECKTIYFFNSDEPHGKELIKKG
jgi:hypothetical protein